MNDSLKIGRNNKKEFAYDFYRRVLNGEDQHIGSLIEKRKQPDRITCVSIMNYARLFACREVFEDRVYFVRKEI